MTRAVFLLLLALPLAGCVAELALVSSTLIGGTAIVQRYEDRQAQRAQTAEIRALREEIAAFRALVEQYAPGLGTGPGPDQPAPLLRLTPNTVVVP